VGLEDGPTASPGTEYVDVSLSDHASLAPLAVHDAPQPLVLAVPIDPNPYASPLPLPLTLKVLLLPIHPNPYPSPLPPALTLKVLLVPIDPAALANPEPQPCTASEAELGRCALCDATDARLGRHNCSGHGPFTAA